MSANHTHDHTHALDAQCTCNIGRWPGGPEWDPDCPRHGRYAELPTAGADPALDIDTSYQEGGE